MTPQKKYIFYVIYSGKTAFNFKLPEGYHLKIWKPSIFKLPPKLLSRFRFILWSIMHFLKLFNGPDYSIFLVYYNEKIIHYSGVLPKYFKYPFMDEKDIQIGPSWTQEEHQRRGIASFVVSKIIEVYKKPGRRFWYITREENIPSVDFIESIGFLKYGVGIKKNRFRIGGLSYFYITDKC